MKPEVFFKLIPFGILLVLIPVVIAEYIRNKYKTNYGYMVMIIPLFAVIMFSIIVTSFYEIKPITVTKRVFNVDGIKAVRLEDNLIDIDKYHINTPEVDVTYYSPQVKKDWISRAFEVVNVKEK